MEQVNLEDLVQKIKDSYEQGVTMEAAERLAGEFLYAQLSVAQKLQAADLDARMRKNGVKAVKSAVRMEEVKKFEKKPTEGHLDDVVNINELVQSEHEAFDKAEVARDLLQNYLGIFKDAHIHFRGIAKGSFGG